MAKAAMVCPNNHEPILDEEKSNENWAVYKDPCPTCGEKLEIKII